MIDIIRFKNSMAIRKVNLFQSSVILTFVVGDSLIILLLCLIMIHDIFHLFAKHFISQKSLSLDLGIS